MLRYFCSSGRGKNKNRGQPWLGDEETFNFQNIHFAISSNIFFIETYLGMSILDDLKKAKEKSWKINEVIN